jgi:ectoine hydroxylase-related dioxygenase (phytanoyl-CoA dioxygenase family)
MSFSTEQIQFFHDKGYLAGPRILSDEQLERFRDRCDAILEGRVDFPKQLLGVASENVEGNPPLRKIANLFRNDPVFAEVVSNPRISALAHDLMAGPVRAWEDQSIAKSPGDAFGEVAWHRDYTYWDHVGPPELATCWIALDDATVENGCMCVMPGSHRWNLDYKRADVDNDNANWVLERPDIPEGADLTPVACEVKAGHCHFHHCLLLHGSTGNRSRSPRRSYILHLMPGTTRRIGDGWNPRMGSIDDVSIGDIVQGPSYPELASVEPTATER